MRALRPILIAALALAAALLCVSLFAIFTTRSLVRSAELVPATQAALVPGAALKKDKTPSVVLAQRADKAIELYRGGKVAKILVTGDNSTLSHDEVSSVRRYLTLRGVAPEDIFLDHAGFDTYSSMYRARDVFAVQSLTVVSQRYHLPRALFIANKLGLTAYGVDASQGEPYFYYALREIPATAKAAFDILLRREPKFLGPQHPITGDGRETWYEGATSTPDLLP